MLERDYFRRGVAEFVGTFALIFVAAGGAAFARTPTDLALANGLVIGVMVSAFGFISGGHFNPAVTLGFFVTRRIAPPLAVWYWLVQFGGAALAALLLKWILPSGPESGGSLGVPAINSGIGTGAAVVVEAVLTFFLVWVIFATAVDPRGSFQQIAGLAIGLTIAFGVLMAYALTGAAMNPARAFGPQLVGNHWAHGWVWYVGPFAGGVIAATLYEMLYLRPPQPAPVGPPETGVIEPRPGDAAAS
ncbi:MAG TPA: aquaporin [Gaiellaceae bacterium]|nr:aquaporin [Gaiellaceae bacterium]HZU20443.1 aquaporin [Gaiellaceae bacterium]